MNAERNKPITIEGPALDIDGEQIIFRGVVALGSLANLLVDDYQREELTVGQRASIFEALRKGEPLPDIELGMRGDGYRQDEVAKTATLRGPTYIIDGYQRVRTIIDFLGKNPGVVVRLGAKIFIGTTKEWERMRFETLNIRRVKVAPSVMLRNQRDTSTGTDMLWHLTQMERTCVMYNRVCWTQNMARGELITAGQFGFVATKLHAHKSAMGRGNMSELARALDRGVEVVGVQNMRENLRTFWTLIDECWGIQRVEYRSGNTHLKGTFLTVLAKFFSDHYTFWETDKDERKLFIHAPLRRKLAQFRIHDPEVVRLAGSSGKAADVLYILLRGHMNSGKRTKRLQSRHGDVIMPVDPGAEDADETT